MSSKNHPMKTCKTLLLVIFITTGFIAQAQYEEPGFYSNLVKGEKIDRVEGNLTVIYQRMHISETDTELLTFDSSLVQDSIEIKFITVQRRTRKNGGQFYVINGRITHELTDTIVMSVGVRFTSVNKWIPFSHPLLFSYLQNKNPILAKKYKKHVRHHEPMVAVTGVIITGGTLMVDGFLLFGWHPVFVPFYAAGAAVAGVGFVLHIVHGRPHVLHNIVNDYNRT